MSYQIYTSRAYIIGRIPVAEADIDLRIVSESHGVIWARMAGARKGTSKMRMHANLYNLVNISLVQGRIWRIVGIEMIAPCCLWDTAAVSVLSQVFHVMGMLHRGEIDGAEIFHVTDRILQTQADAIHPIKGFEMWCMLNILSAYGYWDNAVFDVPEQLTMDVATVLSERSRELVPLINQSLYDSQLVR